MRFHIKQLLGFVLLAMVIAATTWALRAHAAASTQEATQDPIARYLGVSEKEHASLTEHDPTFDADLHRLRAAVEQARTTLAAQIEKPDTTDKVIRDQVEVVINANTALQRRVMEHVLVLRDHLTHAQQERLLSLCAQGIRQGPGWGMGRGAGGLGNGPPDGAQGPRFGQGSGRGYRGGRGAATTSSARQ